MYSPNRFEFTNEPPSEADITIDSSTRGPQELLQRIAKALSFPDYFGENWNALIDCLSDLFWVEKPEVIIDHTGLPRLSEKDTQLYLESLIDAVDRLESRPGSLPRLRILFRTEDRPAIAAALAPLAPS